MNPTTLQYVVTERQNQVMELRPADTSDNSEGAANGNSTSASDEPAIAKLTDPVKIRINDLNIYYGQTHAIKDISVDIPEGQVTALMGPSGCGKSTFLRALNRMHDLTPSARITGTILLDGEDIYAPDADVVHLRQRVGMVFQRPNPFPEIHI